MWKKSDYIFVITSAVILIFVVTGLYHRGYFNYTAEPQIVGSVSYESPTQQVELPSPSPTPTPSSISLTFAGDIMLDRHIRKHAQERGGYEFVLSDLTDLLQQADVVVANLEGPVTTSPSRSMGSAVGSTNNFIFTFDPLSLDLLKKNNITLVNVGNNHILNFGLSGLAETYQHLDQAQFEYFGNAGQGQETPHRWYVKEMNGVKIGFVNYNQFVGDGLPAALQDLQAAQASSDLVIVYTHWGNEYVQENQVIKNLAYQFIDAGADLIIGSHPHVIQGTEDYNGKRIYYSLGNFIFDQYFEPAVQQGLLVHVTINPVTLEMTFAETTIKMNKDGSTTPGEPTRIKPPSE